MSGAGVIQRLVLLLICLLTVEPVYAQSGKVLSKEEARDRASRIASTVMSPYCPGRTLSGCASGQARDLRWEIEGMFRQGKSKDEVMEVLLQRFGDDIYGAPANAGFDRLAYMLPWVFMLLLGGGFVLLLRKLRKGASTLASVETGEADGVKDEKHPSKEIVREIEELLHKQLD